jgi:hypothetical protein
MFVQNTMFAQVDTISVKSIEGITNRMLELISGEVGEERNWDKFRNLFLPTAQMTSTSKSKDGKTRVSVMNLEEFVRNIGPLYARDGFEEYAIGLSINEFNGIANVFQSYYCKNLIGTYEERGVNSYQLIYKDDRWWIAHTMFTNETSDTALPDKFLFEENRNKK